MITRSNLMIIKKISISKHLYALKSHLTLNSNALKSENNLFLKDSTPINKNFNKLALKIIITLLISKSLKIRKDRHKNKNLTSNTRTKILKSNKC